MKLDQLVGKYIQLRDKKAVLKKKYEGEVAKVDELLEKIEGTLLKTFQETGLESVKTEFGTAYTSARVSATVADWDSFFPWVKDSGSWEFLEKRCSKQAVEQFRAANDDLPPGINWSETITVNVRRS